MQSRVSRLAITGSMLMHAPSVQALVAVGEVVVACEMRCLCGDTDGFLALPLHAAGLTCPLLLSYSATGLPAESSACRPTQTAFL